MAGNNERKNMYFDERNMSPSHQQYSPSYNIDNNNLILRPPPGLSPVPHFVSHIHGNPLIGPGPNNQQHSYPLMTKQNNGNNFYNMAPPPGYAYFTPPQSPLFAQQQHSSSPSGNLDHHLHHYQDFVQSSMYSFPGNNNYHQMYKSEDMVPDFAPQDTAYISSGQHSGTATISQANNAGLIEPIIENIVGTSSGGTYTHFGPAHPVGGMSGLNASLNGGHFSNITSGSNNKMQHQYGRNIDEVPVSNKEKKRVWKDSSFTKNSDAGITIGKAPMTMTKADVHAVQRPSTPISPALSAKGKSYASTLDSVNTATNSGKPSYLEVLTKSCTKNMENGKNATSNKSYASASEVQASRDSPTHQAVSGYPFIQIHNQVNRKLSDGFLGGLISYGSGGDGTSNSSTASSSPIVKPKVSQNAFLKGKENSFVQRSSPPTTNSKGTPVKAANNNNITPPYYGTPTKLSGNEWTRKIGNTKKPGGSGKFGVKNITYLNNMASSNDAIASPFDFDIEDIDDEALLENSNSNHDEKSGKKRNGDGSSAKDKGKKNTSSVTNGLTNNISSDRRISDGKGQTGQFSKKLKDKVEKPRSRKEERNCTVRRVRIASAVWLGRLIAALNWLWTLLLSVTTLSVSLGYSLLEDIFTWWKSQAVPKFVVNYRLLKGECSKLRTKLKFTKWKFWSKEAEPKKPETTNDLSELLSILGPERNITLPVSGDEALQRLLSVKGKDPYSILGVRSDSGDDTIRRYYKRQAVLVHPDKNLVPGAEEAFKILARAFEFVGEPIKRAEYHHQLLEAHAKERFMGEFGNLFEQLRKKMESVCTTIRCTKCNARHKKNRTDRPVFAARFCAQCRIHHAAREGELWAEKKGMFGFWQYYACMGNQVWEMNEWGKCQRKSLKHLVPDSHAVIYRLVSGAQTGQPRGTNGVANGSTSPNADDDLLDPEMEDWDSLIHNLCRGTSNTTSCNGSATSHQKGTSRTVNGHTVPNGSAANGYGNGSSASAKKRKGKRK